jgi:hypothetical protein
VRSEVIQTQGKAASGTSPQTCSAFRLTDNDVLQFVATADEVDVRRYAADLGYAPCSVAGTLTLENGLSAKWEIEMSRRGRVLFDDERVMLLHCLACDGPYAR